MTIAPQDAALRLSVADHPLDDDSPRAGCFTISEAGQGGWRVTDDRKAADDPGHVVAFVGDRGPEVEVLWIRGSIDAPGCFATVRHALDAISARIGDG